MKRMFALALAALVIAVAEGRADVIISEDFESYANSSDMQGVWINPVAKTPDEGQLVTDFGNPGQSGFNPGTAANPNNVNQQFFDPIEPTEEAPIHLRVDIYDDATSANERISLGLRFQNPEDPGDVANLLELGFYNQIPEVFFAYRIQLFGSSNVNWQGFSLPDDMNSPAEVGAGWHRFEATIEPDQVTLTLDLHADGTIDAEDIIPASAHLLPTYGFNNIRWGGPSGLSSVGGGANFDNIMLVTGAALLGDVNLDGEVNGLDVAPFVEHVTGGVFQLEADMNEDGEVNGLDVDPFVEAVVGPGGGVQAVPEPSTLLLLLAAGIVGLIAGRMRA